MTPTMPITIATQTDAAELTALVNCAYRGETARKGWASEADLLDGLRIDEDTMRADLGTIGNIILKYVNPEGQIVACVFLQERPEKKLYLGMLTVSPLLQAAGIGKQLLKEAESFAEKLNCKTIMMTVITARTSLINWYLRRGYHLTEEIVPFTKVAKFGIPKQPIELVVLEKHISGSN